MNQEDDQDWETGLPAPEELMPLTQTLITPDLASAFSITLEPAISAAEVPIAPKSTSGGLRCQGNFFSSLDSHHTTSVQDNQSLAGGASLRSEKEAGDGGPPVISFSDGGHFGKELSLDAGFWNLETDQNSIHQHQSSKTYGDSIQAPLERMVDNGYGNGVGGADSSECGAGGSGKKPRRRLDVDFEDADSSACMDNSSEEPAARTLKRPRLVWTPQLHKRFVDAVAHLGIKNAVPKTIMQLMNVDGLTRENVASHLQKYRLYLKRMQGLSSEGPSISDHLFASTPVPPSLAASARFLSNHGEDLFPLLMPVPMAGIGHGHLGPPLGPAAPYSSFDHHIYNSLARSSSQRLPPGDLEYAADNQGRSGSPQRQVLTLFPTSHH